MKNSQFKSNLLGYHGIATGFLELLINKIEMSKEFLTQVEYSHPNKNPQIIILYDIIQDWLFLNHL